MPASARYAPLFSFVAAAATLLLAIGPVQAAPASAKGSTHPLPQIYPCAGQLKRAADVVITMQANKMFYQVTTGVAPTATPAEFDAGYPMTAAAAEATKCKRRAIDIVVPSTASSGCADCYTNAEANACAGTFSGSTLFEHHCHVPQASTSATKCQTFTHRIEVYRKLHGEAEFAKTPISSYVYRGYKDTMGNICRVADKTHGQTWDTAEVYPNVVPPTTGTDVYRVLSLPMYDGALVDTVLFVEFEHM